MSFSAYTGWAIPEGVVTQIADASGRVIWSAVQEHDVVIAGGTLNVVMAQRTVEIDGNAYPLTMGSTWMIVTKNTSEMIVDTTQVNMGTATVQLNGETIFTGVGKCAVDLSEAATVNVLATGAVLSITTYNIPAPEDVTVTVTGVGSTSAAFIKYNDTTYTSATTFTAKTGDLIYVQYINAPMMANYYYVVTSNIEVKLACSSYTSGTVTITET